MSWIPFNDTIEIIRNVYNEYNELSSNISNTVKAYVESENRNYTDKTGQNKTSSFLVIVSSNTDILDSDELKYNGNKYTIANLYEARGLSDMVVHKEVLI